MPDEPSLSLKMDYRGWSGGTAGPPAPSFGSNIFFGFSDTDNPIGVNLAPLTGFTSPIGDPSPLDGTIGPSTDDYLVVLISERLPLDNVRFINRAVPLEENLDETTSFIRTAAALNFNDQTFDAYTLGPLNPDLTFDLRLAFGA